MIPYARQSIDKDDIKAVTDALLSSFITTGPLVEKFEKSLAHFTRVKRAVAVNSGTAALHSAMHALGIGPGDEVIVPAVTFVATGNAVMFTGARPKIVDVDEKTLLIDPIQVKKALNEHTKAVISVDYAGQPCDYLELNSICKNSSLYLISDSCHALGALYMNKPVAQVCDMACYSFHPAKHITCGEGGAVVTDSDNFAEKILQFRNHGLSADFKARQEKCTWFYEMEDIGYNYRISDIQCALGISQLKKLEGWLKRRREIAYLYDNLIEDICEVTPLKRLENRLHAYHLYVVRLDPNISRDKVFKKMRERGIGVNVHYLPLHLHSFYRQKFHTREGENPVAEAAAKQILTLPLYPALTNDDVYHIVRILKNVISEILHDS